MNHGDLDPSLAGAGPGFIVLAQPSTPAQPSQGSFHDPAPGQYLKGMLVGRASHNLQQPAARSLYPVFQLSPIRGVGPNQPQAGKAAPELDPYQPGPIPILDLAA